MPRSTTMFSYTYKTAQFYSCKGYTTRPVSVRWQWQSSFWCYFVGRPKTGTVARVPTFDVIFVNRHVSPSVSGTDTVGRHVRPSVSGADTVGWHISPCQWCRRCRLTCPPKCQRCRHCRRQALPYFSLMSAFSPNDSHHFDVTLLDDPIPLPYFSLMSAFSPKWEAKQCFLQDRSMAAEFPQSFIWKDHLLLAWNYLHLYNLHNKCYIYLYWLSLLHNEMHWTALNFSRMYNKP